jgi:hypothetical protein
MSPLSHAQSFAARPWFTGSTQQSEELTEASYTPFIRLLSTNAKASYFRVQARTLSCDAVPTLVVLSDRAAAGCGV